MKKAVLNEQLSKQPRNNLS